MAPTNVPIGSREVQYTGTRAALALVLHIDGRSYDLGLWTAVLGSQVGDVGSQGFQVAGAGIVDEVINGLE